MTLWLLLGLLIASGVISGAETAVFSLPKAVRRQLVAKSSRVRRLLSRPSSLLVTLLLANLVINVAYFSVSATWSMALAREGHGGLSALVGVGSVLAIVVFGEIVPKTLALGSPGVVVARLTPAMQLLSFGLTPAVAVSEAIIRVLEGLIPGIHRRAEPVAAADFKSALGSRAAMGAYRTVELTLLEDVVDFGTRRARQLMTPRVQVAFLDLADGRAAWQAAMAEHTHHDYPVCNGTLDEIVGTVNTARVLTSERPLEDLIEAPLFVPENVSAERLVGRMAAEGRRIAILLDEFGGVDGVVSLSALAHAVLGEIEPMASVDPLRIERRGASLVVRGDLPLHELEEEAGVAFAARRADTVGGMLAEALGRLPRRGDAVTVEGWRLRVVDGDGRSGAARVLVRPTAESDSPPAEPDA